MQKSNQLIKLILPLIDSDIFKIPNQQKEDSYFPEYLESLLQHYIETFNNKLSKSINDEDITLRKIKALSKVIISSVKTYYQGKIYEASNLFTTNLNQKSLEDLIFVAEIEKDAVFYRARINNGKQFKNSDLFHIKYEDRHNVSTNRYSIPGLPALYLGNSTYVCWEEFEKAKLRDLWFVKLENQKKIKVILIQRIEDLLEDIKDEDEELKYTLLIRYLTTFPLILASTIKVKKTTGNFKPEYIIPQMLFEYIASNKTIDGIQFPSTKIDYSSLENIEAYNFVFPVKNIAQKGYCSDLSNKFYLTEPTSLDLEEIIHNSQAKVALYTSDAFNDIRKIELIKDVKVQYNNTSFGKLEQKLKNRRVYKVK